MASHQNPFHADYDDPPQFRTAHQAQKTSALAVLSVISGILSFPMMCLCFFSIPFSIFAIVCGHMSRGVVRNSQGEYSGLEMGTIGMLMGYSTLALVGGFLVFAGVSDSGSAPTMVPRPPAAQPAATTAESVLLNQAETRLRSDELPATGIATTDGDAVALARHFIDTLQLLDQTHFAETNEAVESSTRDYRVFVQLNEDSVAFLVFVPQLNRFTEKARETLQDDCWLIGKRSVDDILREGDRLAVGIYGEAGADNIMTGITASGGTTTEGLQNDSATATELAAFFPPDRRIGRPNEQEIPIDSLIDTRELPAEQTLPAEVE